MGKYFRILLNLVFIVCLMNFTWAQNFSLFPSLNDSIKTGKIDFSLENQRKKSKKIDKYMFTLIFSKDENGMNFNFIDSLKQRQYVCNGDTVYIIDHKKSKYGNTNAYNKPTRKFYAITMNHTLNNAFLDYYLGSSMQKHLPKQIENKQVSTNNDTINLTGKMTIRWNHIKKAKDSLAAITDANVEIIFEPETMILKSYRKILTDKKSFKKGTILQCEYTLLSVRINDEKYALSQYYEGLYYARGYKPFPNDNYKNRNKDFYNW